MNRANDDPRIDPRIKAHDTVAVIAHFTHTV
jgi:hypothetical protein